MRYPLCNLAEETQAYLRGDDVFPFAFCLLKLRELCSSPRAARCGKIRVTHLDNTMIADELANAVEDEGEAHAKHN